MRFLSVQKARLARAARNGRSGIKLRAVIGVNHFRGPQSGLLSAQYIIHQFDMSKT
jgi:hypothetical protein